MNTIHYFFATLKTANRFNQTKYLILFLTITAILTSCKDSTDQLVATQPPVLPVTILNESAETTFVEYPASIQGSVDIDVRPQVSGYIESVLVNEGAYVSAGQNLFKINAQPYIEALNSAKANLNSSEAAILNAQLEIDKLTPLVQNKVVSDYQLKSAKIAYKIAQANVQQFKSNVASAQINLGYTNVKATVSGYIGRIPLKQGSLVSPADSTPLTQLSDIREMHVYFSLAEKDFSVFNHNYPGKTPEEKIKYLPPVELILDDNTVHPAKGKIDMINGQFDKTTGAIALRATFSNVDGNLRSGNTGKLRLGLKHDNAILVPQSATMEMQDKIFVFIVNKDNKVSKIPITVFGKSGVNYLIKDGLKSGDRIVLTSLDRLQDGQLIQPQKPTKITASLIN